MSNLRLVPSDMTLNEFTERYVNALREHGTAVFDTEVQAYLQASPVAAKLTQGAEEAWQDLGELPAMPPDYSLARETFDVVGLTSTRRRATAIGWPLIGFTLIFLTLIAGLVAVNVLSDEGTIDPQVPTKGQARVVDLRKFARQEQRVRDVGFLLESRDPEERREGVRQSALLGSSLINADIWIRLAEIAEGDPESDIQLSALGLLAPSLGLENTANLSDMRAAVREAMDEVRGGGGLIISEGMKTGERPEVQARASAYRRRHGKDR